MRMRVRDRDLCSTVDMEDWVANECVNGRISRYVVWGGWSGYT